MPCAISAVIAKSNKIFFINKSYSVLQIIEFLTYRLIVFWSLMQ